LKLAIGGAPERDFVSAGLVAEWLRRGLQILAPRFDSGRGLQSIFDERIVPATRHKDRFLEWGKTRMATSALDHSCASQRLAMVNGQLRTSDVRDPAVLAAFLDVPRESFVAAGRSGLAYLDQDQPAAGSKRRMLLAPRTLALMLQAASISPGDRVLDIGGGSGYSAAVLLHMGASVVALESDPGAVEAARGLLVGRPNIEIVEGDLAAGAPDKGPYVAIVINGAFETTPSALFDQLAKGGRLVGIDARAGAKTAVIIDRSSTGFSERALFEATAEVLDGFVRPPAFAF
jgi:protein-L-isoaspartate(D-aspartate) O-methyltransferase